jgi:hypothetical protein
VTAPTAAITLVTEPVPWASADRAVCREVSADFRPLIWTLNWPLAALSSWSISVFAVFSSASDGEAGAMAGPLDGPAEAGRGRR